MAESLGHPRTCLKNCLTKKKPPHLLKPATQSSLLYQFQYVIAMYFLESSAVNPALEVNQRFIREARSLNERIYLIKRPFYYCYTAAQAVGSQCEQQNRRQHAQQLKELSEVDYRQHLTSNPICQALAHPQRLNRVSNEH